LKWQAPQMKYLVNEKEYQHDYYLVDRDIPWIGRIREFKTMTLIDKYRLFAGHQDGARKDV
jgi:hypothetical protein